MKRTSFNLKGLVEDLTFEMWEELGEENAVEIGEFQYASNTFCENVFLPQVSLVDSENYSLDGTDTTTGTEEALKAMYETTSLLEKCLKAYNTVLKRRLETFKSQREEEDFPLTISPERLKECKKHLEDFSSLTMTDPFFSESMKESERLNREWIEELGKEFGETDLNNPNVFDNKRFEGE